MRPTVLACLVLVALGRTDAATVEFEITDARGETVADAVVSLVPLGAASPPSPRNVSAEIEQVDQEFRPYVTAVRAGTTVAFPNRDKVEHYIYSQSPAKKIALPLYKPGKTETVLFDKPGVVTLGCNIHDPMIAYVVVVDSPWFAVTPADGRTVLSEVPPGHYRAEVWQPRLSKPQSGAPRVESREVVVVEGAAPSPLAFALTLGPDRRIRRAVDSKDSGYR
jgi:plastocyanin